MLVTLRRIVQEVSAATRLEEALSIIVRRVKESLPVDACSVYLTAIESDQYILMAADWTICAVLRREFPSAQARIAVSKIAGSAFKSQYAVP